MTPEILQATREMIAAHKLPTRGNLIEFGAYNVNGTQRVNFPDFNYVGVDIEAGACVDIVADVTKLHNLTAILENHGLPSCGKYDVVVCCETLEHVPIFWDAMETITTMCKPHGYILLSFPTFGFPYHAFPIDCNRFTMDAVNAWGEYWSLNILEHREVKDSAENPCLVVLMKKRHDVG